MALSGAGHQLTSRIFHGLSELIISLEIAGSRDDWILKPSQVYSMDQADLLWPKQSGREFQGSECFIGPVDGDHHAHGQPFSLGR